MNRRNLIALLCGGLVMLMTGAAFAAVPLYRLFCQVTGFNGTVMRAAQAPETVLEDRVLVRFDTNVRDLPLTFHVRQTTQRVRIGDTALAYFDVTNTSDRPVTAVALYNVTPARAGPYFQKLQCFCFDAQTLKPGETTAFPVQYFVAPELATDREGRGVKEITLSYTFYPAHRARQEADSGSGAAG